MDRQCESFSQTFSSATGLNKSFIFIRNTRTESKLQHKFTSLMKILNFFEIFEILKFYEKFEIMTFKKINLKFFKKIQSFR
jgi:hypothetical protein